MKMEVGIFMKRSYYPPESVSSKSTDLGLPSLTGRGENDLRKRK
jgi:hypothetical protein